MLAPDPGQMIDVKGNGKIVSGEIRVSSFIRLHLSGKGLIGLYSSDEEKVIIETMRISRSILR